MWTHKYTIIISQKHWAGIDGQKWTIWLVPDMDLNQTLFMVKLTISKKSHNKGVVYLMQKVEIFDRCWNMINKFPRSDLGGRYTDKQYILFVIALPSN